MLLCKFNLSGVSDNCQVYILLTEWLLSLDRVTLITFDLLVPNRSMNDPYEYLVKQSEYLDLILILHQFIVNASLIISNKQKLFIG